MHSSRPKRARSRHISLELTEAAREHLAAAGYDPNYGARPLKRAIQKELETPLGRLLLKGEASDGQTVMVDRDEARGALRFTVKAGGEAKSNAASEAA